MVLAGGRERRERLSGPTAGSGVERGTGCRENQTWGFLFLLLKEPERRNEFYSSELASRVADKEI